MRLERRRPRTHPIIVQISRLAPRAVAAFHDAPKKAGTFRCKDTGIGEAVAATVVHAEQHAAVDRFGSPF